MEDWWSRIKTEVQEFPFLQVLEWKEADLEAAFREAVEQAVELAKQSDIFIIQDRGVPTIAYIAWHMVQPSPVLTGARLALEKESATDTTAMQTIFAGIWAVEKQSTIKSLQELAVGTNDALLAIISGIAHVFLHLVTKRLKEVTDDDHGSWFGEGVKA